MREWREIIDVTLDGAFHCVKACLPHLKQSGAGAIVNIGGLSGQTGSKDRAHVVAAKSGLVGLDARTGARSRRRRRHGQLRGAGPDRRPRGRRRFVEPQHHQVHHTLSGKRGEPQDIAAIVRFLCGPGARYITGQTIHANGGAFIP